MPRRADQRLLPPLAPPLGPLPDHRAWLRRRRSRSSCFRHRPMRCLCSARVLLPSRRRPCSSLLVVSFVPDVADISLAKSDGFISARIRRPWIPSCSTANPLHLGRGRSGCSSASNSRLSCRRAARARPDWICSRRRLRTFPHAAGSVHSTRACRLGSLPPAERSASCVAAVASTSWDLGCCFAFVRGLFRPWIFIGMAQCVCHLYYMLSAGYWDGSTDYMIYASVCCCYWWSTGDRVFAAVSLASFYC